MKVEVTIDTVQGETVVVDARCSGTLFRGFEAILANRDPWDAPIITARICGVCPVSHTMASVKALDRALGLSPTENARILRNLVLGSNFIQSHILHFYLLALFDYVKGPAGSPWSPTWEIDLRAGLGHILENFPMAIQARRQAHEMGAIFGGRMPSPHSSIPGGVTAVPNGERIDRFRGHLDRLIRFIRNAYIPDAESLAAVYGEYLSMEGDEGIGTGCGRLLAFGVFDQNAAGSDKLLHRGGVDVRAPNRVRRINTRYIKEDVTHGWYEDGTNNRNPVNGSTKPQYPKARGYSWLKAPRYGGRSCEVGALARMWVTGEYRNGTSVMDRHLARAYETLFIAEAMQSWLDELTPRGEVYRPSAVKAQSGIGLTEAPRGALGHWVTLNQGKIQNYQIITPTCWNASPKDGRGVRGPIEQALVGTPVSDPARPIEALRVVHSFDPCLSCAVHVMRPGGEPVVVRAGAGRGRRS